MFFVSEEFLRKYGAGEEVIQTIDEAVAPGSELFNDITGKRGHNLRHRNKRKKKHKQS